MANPIIRRSLERLIEIVFSLLLLLTLFPWIYLVVAAVLKRRSPGPAIVVRQRRRADGRVYGAYRFRLADEESLLARTPGLMNMLVGHVPIHITVAVDEGEPVVDTPAEEPIFEPLPDDTSTEPQRCVDEASTILRRASVDATPESTPSEAPLGEPQNTEPETPKTDNENVDIE